MKHGTILVLWKTPTSNPQHSYLFHVPLIWYFSSNQRIIRSQTYAKLQAASNHCVPNALLRTFNCISKPENLQKYKISSTLECRVFRNLHKSKKTWLLNTKSMKRVVGPIWKTFWRKIERKFNLLAIRLSALFKTILHSLMKNLNFLK